MLSRKYYQQFSRIVAHAVHVSKEAGDIETCVFIRDRLVYPLMEVMKRDNPNFDSVRFFEACGVTREVRW